MEWQFEKAIVSSVNEILMTFYKETMSPIGGLLSTDYLRAKAFPVGLSVSKNWETLSCEIRLSAGFVTS